MSFYTLYRSHHGGLSLASLSFPRLAHKSYFNSLCDHLIFNESYSKFKQLIKLADFSKFHDWRP